MARLNKHDKCKHLKGVGHQLGMRIGNDLCLICICIDPVQLEQTSLICDSRTDKCSTFLPFLTSNTHIQVWRDARVVALVDPAKVFFAFDFVEAIILWSPRKVNKDYCARFSFKLTLFISADGKENGRILYEKVVSPFNGLKQSFPWTMQKLTLVLKLRILNWLPAPLN